MTNYIVHTTYRAPMFYYVSRRTNKLIKSCFYCDISNYAISRNYAVFSTYEDAVAYQAMRCL